MKELRNYSQSLQKDIKRRCQMYRTTEGTITVRIMDVIDFFDADKIIQAALMEADNSDLVAELSERDLTNADIEHLQEMLNEQTENILGIDPTEEVKELFKKQLRNIWDLGGRKKNSSSNKQLRNLTKIC
jgi:hypothetical protein